MVNSTIKKFSLFREAGWGKYSQDAAAVAALCLMKRFIVKPETFGCGDVIIVESISITYCWRIHCLEIRRLPKNKNMRRGIG